MFRSIMFSNFPSCLKVNKLAVSIFFQCPAVLFYYYLYTSVVVVLVVMY